MVEPDCPLCNILSRTPRLLLYENHDHIAFLEETPVNLGHAIVASKKHYESLLDMPAEEASSLFAVVIWVARSVKEGVKAEGINIGYSNGKSSLSKYGHPHANVVPRFTGDVEVGFWPERKKVQIDALIEKATTIRKLLSTNPIRE